MILRLVQKRGKCHVSISSTLPVYCLGLNFIARALFAGISCQLMSPSSTLIGPVMKVINKRTGGKGKDRWRWRGRGKERGTERVRVDMEAMKREMQKGEMEMGEGFQSDGFFMACSLPPRSQSKGILPRLHLQHLMEMKTLLKLSRPSMLILVKTQYISVLLCVAWRSWELHVYIAIFPWEFPSACNSVNDLLLPVFSPVCGTIIPTDTVQS